MGTNNRQRRAEKQKQWERQQQRRQRTGPAHVAEPRASGARDAPGRGAAPPRGAVPPRPERSPRGVLADGVAAVHRGDERVSAACADELAGAVGGAAVLEGALVDQVCGLFEGGWEPQDVAHVVRRQRRAVHTALLVPVLAAAAARSSGRVVPARWRDQLADVGADRVAETPAGLLARFAAAAGSPLGAATFAAGVELLALLARVPLIEPLGPPPSAWPAVGSVAARMDALAGRAGLDPKILERVRALLAKAESTTFDEEADAFTAKAQELMAKHAIDAAALAAGRAASGTREQPVQRRVWIDDPYAGPKAQLLSRVADANRCRAVFDSGLGCSSVIGFASDLDVVDVLFTSLLLQASAAMTRAGSVVDRGGTSRTRSFRQSFLVSYAVRIGERLREASAAATTAARAEHGDALLPVLATRDEAVASAFERAFPRVGRMRSSVSNGAGWAAGRAAADAATLGPSHALGGAS